MFKLYLNYIKNIHNNIKYKVFNMLVISNSQIF